MILAIKKTGLKFAVHEASADGKPTGTAIHIVDTYPEAVALAGKNAKCYDMDMEYTYVPYSAVTLREALEAQSAQEYAQEVSTVARMYKQLVDHVLDNFEVKDKGEQIVKIAQEFAAWLKDSSKTPTKAVPVIPAPVISAVPDYSVIKSLENDRIGSYAVLWGTESKKDLTEQFFTVKTAELTAIFDVVGKLPWIYHHTMDGEVKTKVAGVVDVLKADSVGLWYEAQLKKADEYDEYIKKLISAGKLKTSSQTFPAAMEYNTKTGEITRWPIVEISGTPSPAEYRMPAIELLKAAFADLGITDFAQVDKYTPQAKPEQGTEKVRLELELLQLI